MGNYKRKSLYSDSNRMEGYRDAIHNIFVLGWKFSFTNTNVFSSVSSVPENVRWAVVSENLARRTLSLLYTIIIFTNHTASSVSTKACHYTAYLISKLLSPSFANTYEERNQSHTEIVRAAYLIKWAYYRPWRGSFLGKSDFPYSDLISNLRLQFNSKLLMTLFTSRIAADPSA